MLLREWRLKRDLSLAAFAGLVGAGNATVVSRWERKIYRPQPPEMIAIYRVTGGQVTPNDFYDLPDLEAA